MTLSMPPRRTFGELGDSVDITIPSEARVQDFLLGGGHNFAADRRLAAEQERVLPDIRDIARWHREFLRRAVQYAVRSGVRQFLDIGSGLLTVGAVHEIACAQRPDAVCVYVDQDPVAVAQIVLTLARGPHTAVWADFCDPEELLHQVRASGVLDLDQPVALLLLGMLHCVLPDREPARQVACYRDALAPGSLLIMSHLTDDGLPEPRACAAEKYRRICGSAGMSACFRTRAEFQALFAGFDLEDPGVVWATQWRPDNMTSARNDDPSRSMNLVGVGRRLCGAGENGMAPAAWSAAPAARSVIPASTSP